MKTSRLAMALALGSVLFVAACSDDDDPAAPVLERFVANLTVGAEVPAVTTPSTATGTATFTLNAAGDQLTYTMSATGLTGAPSAAHIHLGAAGVQGGVIVTLAHTPAGATTGSVNVTNPAAVTALSVTGAPGGVTNTFTTLLNALRNGTAYVNIHTNANQSGEIRGQLIKQ